MLKLPDKTIQTDQNLSKILAQSKQNINLIDNVLNGLDDVENANDGELSDIDK